MTALKDSSRKELGSNAAVPALFTCGLHVMTSNARLEASQSGSAAAEACTGGSCQPGQCMGGTYSISNSQIRITRAIMKQPTSWATLCFW